MRNKKILISIAMCCSLLITGCCNEKESLDIRKIKTEDIVSTASGVYDYAETFPSIILSEIMVFAEQIWRLKF